MDKNVQWQLRCTMYMRGVTSIEQSLLSFVPEGCYVLELIAIESGGLPGKMLCQRWGQSIGAGNEATQFVMLQFVANIWILIECPWLRYEGTWFQGHHRAWVQGRSGEACWEQNEIHQESSWAKDVKMWTIKYFFPQTKSWIKYISWEVCDSFLSQKDAAGRRRHLFPDNNACNLVFIQF